MHGLFYIFVSAVASSMLQHIYAHRPWKSVDNTFPSFYSGSVLIRNNKCGKYFSYAGHTYDVQGIITDHCPLNYLNPSGGHSVLNPWDGNELPGAGDYQVWVVDNSTKTLNLIALDDYGVRHTVNFDYALNSSDTVNLINPELDRLLVYSDEFDQVVNVIPLSINKEMPEALWTLIPFPTIDHFNDTFYIETHICPQGTCLALTVPNSPLEIPSGSVEKISSPTCLAMQPSLRGSVINSNSSRDIAAQLWKLVQGPNGLFTIKSVLAPDYCITKRSGGDSNIILRATNQGIDPLVVNRITAFSMPELDFLTGYRIGSITLNGDQSNAYLWWSDKDQRLTSHTELDVPNISKYPNSQWNIIPYSPPSQEAQPTSCTMTWKSNCVCTNL